MSNLRRPAIITLLLLAAFIWGYRGDEVVTDVGSLFQSRSHSTAPAAESESAAGTAQADPNQAARNISSAPFPGGMVPSGANPTHPAGTAVSNAQANAAYLGGHEPGSVSPSQAGGRWVYPGPHGAAPANGAAAPPPFPGQPPYPQSSPQLAGQPNPAMAATLDSITPGSVQENQIAQRNLYFEKLSQQLKDLQGGETPPPAQPPTDAGASADINPPAGNPGTVQSEGLIPSNGPQVGAVVPNSENIAIDNPYAHMPNNTVVSPGDDDMTANTPQLPTDPDADDLDSDDSTGTGDEE
jgi:hypothetical protein